MATVIGDLFVRLGVDMTAMNRDLGAAESRMEKFGTQLFFLGSRVTAGVTLPMLAAGAAIAKIGLSVDKAMTESLAIMQGVTPQIRSEMESMAAQVAMTTKFSMKEAAEGYYSLASAGLDAATSMKALPIAAEFAQAGVFGLAQSTEYLASATAAMGTGMETASEKAFQMQRVADVLTEANNRALGSVKDFADALTNRGALAMKQSNIELEQGVAILAAYAERGIKGKAAGQQLWMMLRDLSTHALSSADAFKKHNIAVFNSDGSMRAMADILRSMEDRFNSLTVAQRAQMLTELGIPARSRAATQAILGQSQAIRDHEEALKKAGGAAKAVADNQMEALSNQMLRLKNTFEVAANELFKSMIPAINNYLIPAAKTGLEVFKAFTAVFAAMPDPLKAVALGGVAVVAALGPLVAMLGSMSLLGSAALQGITAMTGGMARLATVAGLAAGGIDFHRVAMLQNSMSTAAATGNVTKYMAASQALAPIMAQLADRQNAAAAAARLAARDAGLVGVAITNAGNAARRAEVALQATTIAASGTAGGFRAILASIGGLMGPVGWTITGLTALAGIAYLVTRRQDLLGEELVAGAEKFRENTSALDSNIKVYTQLIDLHNRQLGLSPDLDRATASLAKQTGLSAEAFIRETKASDSLIISLGGQLDARNRLMQATKDEAVNQYEAAAKAVRHLQQEQAKVQGGLATVGVVDSQTEFTGLLHQRPMSMDERIRANAALDKKIEEAKRIQAEAEAVLIKTSGMASRTDKSTGWLKPPTPKPDDPDFPGAGQPKTKTETEKLRDQLLGQNEEATRLTAVWKTLTAAQQGNIGVQLNLWEVYSKVRGEAGGMIPLFERLFAQQLLQMDITAQQSLSTETWGNSYSDAANKFIEDSAKIHIAQMGMSNLDVAADWKKHSGAIEELIPLYKQMPGHVQVMIDRFLAWKASMPAGKEMAEGAHRAMDAIVDLGRGTAAKLKDVESDLHQFAETAGDSFRRTTRNKLEQIRADQQKVYEERLSDMGRFTGKELTLYIEHLKKLKTDQDAYVAAVERSELLRYASTIGVNARIIRDHKDKTTEELQEIVKRQEQWNRYFDTINRGVSNFQAFGNVLSSIGGPLEEAGKTIAELAGAMNDMSVGAARFQSGDVIGGTIQMVQGGIDFFKSIADSGWFSDPDWEQFSDTVKRMWGEKVSKELAKKIDADSKMLGGHTNAMLMNLTAIAAETDPINAGNVGKWAERLAETFSVMAQGGMSTAQAANTLDASFGTLLESGTAASGMVNQQIVELVKLDRHYRTGSKAIKEFVDAQLGMATGGFNKIVAGSFGVLNNLLGDAEDADAALAKQNGLFDKRAKLQAQIADYERNGVNNEKQRVALMIARNNLLKVNADIQKEQAKQDTADKAIQALMGPDGQERFDRMGRLAGVMFDAAIASGRGLFETIEAMGPSLDTLIVAQQAFGFTSNDTFTKLMKFREFATLNPELVATISGLGEMMVGLSNLGFMTQGSFRDLGATITDTFNELIDKGLTHEEAMQGMHVPLQRLWEMQKLFNYEVDEATQLLLDEAEASGAVGIQYMSANDRMVLGIDKLIGRFELFLKHLGIDIPAEAKAGADALNDEFNNINPTIRVGIVYEDDGGPRYNTPDGYNYPPDYQDPTMLAEGGVLDRPTFVAGESGAEVVMPLDRLFQELEAQRQIEYEAAQTQVAKLYLDGRLVAQAVLPHVKAILRQHGIE